MRFHLHRYALARDTGKHQYLQCRRCGRRHVRVMSYGGHQPVDRQWLDTGQWTVMGPPPRTPSGYRS